MDSGLGGPLRNLLLRLVVAAFLGLFFLYPLAHAIGRPDWAWFGGDYVQGILLGAFAQATLSVLATFALAMPLAWHHRRALPMGALQRALHAAPFVMPVFVIVGGLRGVLGSGGWTHQWGFDVLGWLGPLGAVVLAHAYYNYGLAARLLHAQLERRPQRLEDAAQVLGAPPATAFARVSLPLLLPALGGIALLVFLFAFTSFGVVVLLGQGVVGTLESLMYQQMQGVFPRPERAAVLAIFQLAVNVALIGGYLRLRKHTFTEEPENRPLPARRRDHVLSWGFLALALTPALAILIGGFRLDGAWSLEPWRSLVNLSHPNHLAGFDLMHVLDRTLFLAFWSTLLSVSLSLALAYSGSRWLDGLSTLPMGTSSVLIGFAYLVSFSTGALDLRGTLWILVLAHTLVSFPFVARTLLPVVRGRAANLDHAAASLGASPWQVFVRVHWPAIRGTLAVAAGFAVAISLGDFGASLLLSQQDTMGLGLWIHMHDQPFRSFAKAQATALTGLLMVMATGALVLVERFRKSGEGW